MQNLQNYKNNLSPSEIAEVALKTNNILFINNYLRINKCAGCELGKKDGICPVVFRGTNKTQKMIVGEAPGQVENKEGKTFVGPAGQLLTRIFSSVGFNIDSEWYAGNIVKCQPVGVGGKQNSIPTVKHCEACIPLIRAEIECLKPRVVVLAGRTAVSNILPDLKDESLSKIVGKIYVREDRIYFPMYHPAYLLHSQNNPERLRALRQEVWGHINLLKNIVEEENIK